MGLKGGNAREKKVKGKINKMSRRERKEIERSR